jgi:hypothetical protein
MELANDMLKKKVSSKKLIKFKLLKITKSIPIPIKIEKVL